MSKPAVAAGGDELLDRLLVGVEDRDLDVAELVEQLGVVVLGPGEEVERVGAVCRRRQRRRWSSPPVSPRPSVVAAAGIVVVDPQAARKAARAADPPATPSRRRRLSSVPR